MILLCKLHPKKIKGQLAKSMLLPFCEQHYKRINIDFEKVVPEAKPNGIPETPKDF